MTLEQWIDTRIGYVRDAVESCARHAVTTAYPFVREHEIMRLRGLCHALWLVSTDVDDDAVCNHENAIAAMAWSIGEVHP